MIKISFVRSLLSLSLAVLAVTVTIQAKTNPAPKSPTTKTEAKRIAWRTQLKPALDEAKRSGKPVLLYFYSGSCLPCRQMDAQTYTHVKVVDAAATWISVKLNGEMELEAAYEYKVASFPKIAFLKPDGTIAGESSGFRTAAELLQSMQSLRAAK